MAVPIDPSDRREAYRADRTLSSGSLGNDRVRNEMIALRSRCRYTWSEIRKRTITNRGRVQLGLGRKRTCRGSHQTATAADAGVGDRHLALHLWRHCPIHGNLRSGNANHHDLEYPADG